MIKAIIYDKDGTLMRFDAFWVPIARSAIKLVLREFVDDENNSICDIEKEIESKIGICGDTADPGGILCGGTYEQFADVVAETLKKRGLNAYVDRYVIEKALLANIEEGKVLPTSENLSIKLAEAKRTAGLFVVTTDNRKITEICLEKLGIADMFDGVYCDDGKTPQKPDPFTANDIVKKCGFSKFETVMVGDTATDRNFAINAGINFVFVGNDVAIAKKCTYTAKNACDATDIILAGLTA